MRELKGDFESTQLQTRLPLRSPMVRLAEIHTAVEDSLFSRRFGRPSGCSSFCCEELIKVCWVLQAMVYRALWRLYVAVVNYSCSSVEPL